MSSILGSQGVVLATAMAVSGTVLLLAFGRQRSYFPSSHPPLRSCMSSVFFDAGKGERKKKKVHFAEDVVDPTGDGEVFRRRQHENMITSTSSSSWKIINGMSENRLALYNGMLRDRLVHRFGYSY